MLGFRVLRVQLHRLLELDDGFLELPFRPQSDAQVVVRLGRLGLQSDRLAEVLDGTIDIAQVEEHCTQIVVGWALIRIERHRPTQVGERLVRRTSACHDGASKVPVELGRVRTDEKAVAELGDRFIEFAAGGEDAATAVQPRCMECQQILQIRARLNHLLGLRVADAAGAGRGGK